MLTIKSIIQSIVTMKASFTIINNLFLIFLSVGILAPMVAFAGAGQKRLHAEQYYQQERERKDHTAMAIVNSGPVSIENKDLERLTRKQAFFKEFVKEFGDELASALAENIINSLDSSCSSDLEYLNESKSQSLPVVDLEIISNACVFSTVFELTQKAEITCNYFLSESFLSKFRLACNDTRFSTTYAKVSTLPGDGNLYASSTDGVSYEVFSFQEANVPICLPNSCSYSDRLSYKDAVEDSMELMRGFDSIFITLPPYSPSRGHRYSLSNIVTLISGLVSVWCLVSH